MQGILFNYELGMFDAVIEGNKTETRRIKINGRKARFKVGEIVFLKEPYVIDDCAVTYKYKMPLFLQSNRYKNKMFMPRKYARYFIEITEVIEEKLNQITEIGALNEGVEIFGAGFRCYIDTKEKYKGYFSSAVDSYISLWDKLNGKKRPYESNPEVHVYKFKLLTK